MRVVAIAVVGANLVIGDGKDQPFKIKADWARFKRTTMGHCLVMGRRTFDAMGELPGRTSLVVTRNPDALDASDTVFPVGSLDAAFALAQGRGEELCFVVGGGEIYAQALERCDELDLTEVRQDAAGNVRFPAIDPAVWIEVSRDEHPDNDPPFAFVRYERA